MGYCNARFVEYTEELSYRIYVTDGVKYILEGRGLAKVSKRYIDIIRPTPEDKRTAEQIISDLTKKAGLKCKRKEVPCEPI